MGKYVIIPNSPVEFAIAGPSSGRDRLLVRSENAGLDVVGRAALFELEDRNQASVGRSLFQQFFGGEASKERAHVGKYPLPRGTERGREINSTPINVVSSYPLADIDPEADARHSKFNFAWKGYASQSGIESVKSAFNSLAPELQRAIKQGDAQEIEWTLAPLIYHCTQVNER